MKKIDIGLAMMLLIILSILVAVPFIVFAGSSDTHTVNMTIAGSNTPTIDDVSVISAQDVTPGSTTGVIVEFTVSDNDGYLNLDNTTDAAVYNKTGETSRSNTTCTAENIDWNTNNYTCNVSIEFYDSSGSWDVNVSISDDDSNYVENTTTSFTYNSGIHMNMTPTAINFGSLNPGDTDKNATDDPITVQNIGNINLTALNITAYDLVGETDSSYFIGPGNFSVNVTDIATGTALINATQVTIPDWTINRGASSTDDAYFWLDVPSTGIQVQSYSTAGGTDWTINVFGTSS